MERNVVTVELIENPAVRRQMTIAGAGLLKGQWRIVGEVKKEIEQKKSDVIPAAVEQEPDLILESLRSNYKLITGKDPKGNWGAKKIGEELKKVQA